MKANRGLRSSLVIAATAVLVTTASCSQRVIPPPPAPKSTPRPTAPRAPAPQLDWRDAPITPGDWRWSMEGGQSVARFADGALILRCDLARHTVTLQRAGTAQGPVGLTVTTSNGSRAVTATPQPGPPAMLAAGFTARDPLLDEMAFSRGRFAVAATGLATLFVPSWPEVSRVVEDCR